MLMKTWPDAIAIFRFQSRDGFEKIEKKPEEIVIHESNLQIR